MFLCLQKSEKGKTGWRPTEFMKPILIYCYDAYCGWCFGFSPVMKKISALYAAKVEIEVLSGGMIIDEFITPIKKMAPVILGEYQRVEEMTGVKFGEDFLWHAKHPEESDWVMNSEKPGIALCIVKELHPHNQLNYASDLQQALNVEGRDLDDDEAYRHLLEKYHLDEKSFYEKLHSEQYRDMARREFSLCKQLQVTGFPAVLLQVEESRFYLLARGYTPFDTLSQRIDAVLSEIKDT